MEVPSVKVASVKVGSSAQITNVKVGVSLQLASVKIRSLSGMKVARMEVGCLSSMKVSSVKIGSWMWCSHRRHESWKSSQHESFHPH
jgi:hypothetical protein